MAKRKTKTLLGLILSLAMVMSTLPATAFANEENDSIVINTEIGGENTADVLVDETVTNDPVTDETIADENNEIVEDEEVTNEEVTNEETTNEENPFDKIDEEVEKEEEVQANANADIDYNYSNAGIRMMFYDGSGNTGTNYNSTIYSQAATVDHKNQDTFYLDAQGWRVKVKDAWEMYPSNSNYSNSATATRIGSSSNYELDRIYVDYGSYAGRFMTNATSGNNKLQGYSSARADDDITWYSNFVNPGIFYTRYVSGSTTQKETYRIDSFPVIVNAVFVRKVDQYGIRLQRAGTTTWTTYYNLNEAINAITGGTAEQNIIELTGNISQNVAVRATGKNFTIRSSEPGTQRTITNNKVTDTALFNLRGCNVVFEDIIIDGGTTSVNRGRALQLTPNITNSTNGEIGGNSVVTPTSLKMTNCVVKNCKTAQYSAKQEYNSALGYQGPSNGEFGGGSAIFASAASNVELIDCTFTDNKFTYHTGSISDENSNSVNHFRYGVINIGNLSKYAGDNPTIKISNLQFSGNTVDGWSDQKKPALPGLANNAIVYIGGYSNNSTQDCRHTLELSDCTFSDKGLGSYGGIIYGALANTGSSITNCTFENNIYYDAGIHLKNGGFDITNSHFRYNRSNNTALSGLDINNEGGGSITITDSTFDGRNGASGEVARGGGIEIKYGAGDITVANSELYYNKNGFYTGRGNISATESTFEKNGKRALGTGSGNGTVIDSTFNQNADGFISTNDLYAYNSHFTNNTGTALQGGGASSVIECDFKKNGIGAKVGGSRVTILNCPFDGNGTGAVVSGTGTIIDSTFQDSTNVGITNNGGPQILNCVLSGNKLGMDGSGRAVLTDVKIEDNEMGTKANLSVNNNVRICNNTVGDAYPINDGFLNIVGDLGNDADIRVEDGAEYNVLTKAGVRLGTAASMEVHNIDKITSNHNPDVYATVRNDNALVWTQTKFIIRTGAMSNGRVTVFSAAAEGTRVTVKPIPANGYELASISWKPDGGTEYDITKDGYFIMPASDVMVYATFRRASNIDPGLIDSFDDKTGGDVKIIASKDGTGYKITLDSKDPCIVAYTDDNGVTYDKLTGIKNTTDGSYTFALDSLPDGRKIVVAKKGDVNFDGKINAIDVLFVRAHNTNTKPLDKFAELVADVTLPAGVDVLDLARIRNTIILSEDGIAWE